jgi:hypothetical protein
MVIITKFRCSFVAATRQRRAVAFCSDCASWEFLQNSFKVPVVLNVAPTRFNTPAAKGKDFIIEPKGTPRK